MITHTTIQVLAELIKTATVKSKKLIDILESEQQALLTEDYDSLGTLIEQKLSVSQELDQVEIQRQEIVSQAGYQKDNTAMSELLNANQDTPATKLLADSWTHLMTTLQAAADQNHLNGILLEKQRLYVKRALNILFEQSPNTDVYDAAGETSQPKYTRSVGIA